MDAFLSRFKTWVKLSGSFGLLLLSLLVVGGFGMYSSAQLGKLLAEMYSVQLTGISELSQAKLAALTHNRTIYELAAEQDAMVIDDILKDMQDHERMLRQHLGNYEKTALSDGEKIAHEKFNDAWKAYVENIAPVAEQARAGKTASAMMIAGGSVQNMFRVANAELIQMGELVTQEALQANESGAAIAAKIRTVSLALMAVAVGLGILNAVIVTRNITRPLSRAVAELRRIAAGDMTSVLVVKGDDESADMLRSLSDVQSSLLTMVTQLKATAGDLDQSVHEVTDDSYQMSRRATESSDAISAAAAVVEELAVSIDVVGNNADEASSRATEAGGAARQGHKLGAEATDDVLKAAVKVGETADMIQDLSGQVQQIGTIANVIKDIADQTNLLALNAAIEAARAGEQGRGFAVVADEVRKLAERTTSSAQEITSMIGAIQTGTGAVVSSMKVSRSTMDVVRDKVSETTEAIRRIESSTASAVFSTGEISSALREQKAASSGIAKSVENIAQLSGENAATAHRLSEAMSKVSHVSAELSEIIARFQVRD